VGNAFIIKYDYFHSNLSVLQNGKATSQLSQFSRCNNQPFDVWFSELPQYCIAEANNSFSIDFTGGEIHSLILRSIFTSCEQCNSYKFSREIINASHRIKWFNELCLAIHNQSHKLSISISSTITNYSIDKISNNSVFRKLDNTHFIFSDMLDTAVAFSYKSKDYSSDIIISNTDDHIQQLGLNRASNIPQLVIRLSNDSPKFLGVNNNAYFISCDSNSMLSIIRNWMCDFILPSYYLTFQRLLASNSTIQTNHNLKTKCDMLTSTVPYLKLKIDSKIKLGQTIAFEFIKYPEDLKCTISADNQSAASVGKRGTQLFLNPQKEGNYKLVARVKEHPELFTSADFLIYRYINVNSIGFNSLPKQIAVGDTFQIQYTVTPTNAHDRNQVSWEIVPQNKTISFQGGNTFAALKPGKCTVTLRVGKASQSISVTILDAAKDIKFDKSSISVKLGNNSSIITTIVSPPNCAVGTIKYHVSDPSILSFDRVNGQIITKAEGSAVLTAVLLDKSGRLVSDCKCNITVTPPKDIITPDPLSVIALLLLISYILLFSFDTLSNTCGFAFIVVSIISIIKKRSVYTVVSCIISVVILITMLFLRK